MPSFIEGLAGGLQQGQARRDAQHQQAIEDAIRQAQIQMQQNQFDYSKQRDTIGDTRYNQQQSAQAAANDFDQTMQLMRAAENSSQFNIKQQGEAADTASKERQRRKESIAKTYNIHTAAGGTPQIWNDFILPNHPDFNKEDYPDYKPSWQQPAAAPVTPEQSLGLNRPAITEQQAQGMGGIPSRATPTSAPFATPLPAQSQPIMPSTVQPAAAVINNALSQSMPSNATAAGGVPAPGASGFTPAPGILATARNKAGLADLHEAKVKAMPGEAALRDARTRFINGQIDDQQYKKELSALKVQQAKNAIDRYNEMEPLDVQAKKAGIEKIATDQYIAKQKLQLDKDRLALERGVKTGQIADPQAKILAVERLNQPVNNSILMLRKDRASKQADLAEQNAIANMPLPAPESKEFALASAKQQKAVDMVQGLRARIEEINGSEKDMQEQIRKNNLLTKQGIQITTSTGTPKKVVAPPAQSGAKGLPTITPPGVIKAAQPGGGNAPVKSKSIGRYNPKTGNIDKY